MTAINELLSNNRAYADGLDAGPHRDVRPSRPRPRPLRDRGLVYDVDAHRLRLVDVEAGSA